MLRDENGKLSSSRIVMFIMVGIFSYLSVAGKTADPVVWSTIQSVILLCLGGASVRGTVSCIGGKSD
tara:strand:+ start:3749 stop:3949 length:201 start_codon:yes stop_codon:yes gene_type:complete